MTSWQVWYYQRLRFTARDEAAKCITRKLKLKYINYKGDLS